MQKTDPRVGFSYALLRERGDLRSALIRVLKRQLQGLLAL